jgi:hypothetical protein
MKLISNIEGKLKYHFHSSENYYFIFDKHFKMGEAIYYGDFNPRIYTIPVFIQYNDNRYL